jgi:hypothetical protein
MLENNKFYLLILIIIIVLYFYFFNSKQTVYFFLNKDDERSLEALNNILKNSDYEVIIVNYDKDKKDLIKLNQVINNCNKIRPINKILNVENMTDINEIYFDTCYRNAKCVNQPSNKFYELYNKMNVFGYPFKFQDNSSELLGKLPTNNLIDVNSNPTCTQPSDTAQRKRSLY